MSPSLVMGSANHWGGPVTTGSQQYARLFVRHGWRVAYLSDPISPYHLVRPRSWLYNRRKFQLWASGGERDLDGRLFAYNHLTLLPVFNAPLLRSSLAVRRSFDLSVPNLARKLDREGFGNPAAVWVDHLSFEALPRRLAATASIYRMADEPELFPGPYPPSLLARLPDLLRSVDLVIATGRRIEERAREYRHEGVLYLPNGVDYHHFTTPRPEPPDIADLPRPRVLYVGSLEPWFDTRLVARAALANPTFSFVVVGPARIPLGELRDLPNVRILGPRPYDVVAGYMVHCDVGIVPFRRTERIQAVHPIKVYEYLAAGLPVVATEWEELSLMGAPIHLASSEEEFIQQVRTAADDPGDAAVRDRFARENSWDARFAVLDAHLSPFLRR